ncbi:hypothetical protein QA601_18305 [Chitinispirillales bacterium ANBcel5]|uniref:hypothetical protein n=1 Tax=Cellulosispirillum alkaliphilum TaxID=3039283 RepID=UPI002A53CB23|nr:hypothetical protein [Chitinispirillales bacterium ANBcel5]
MAIKLYLGLLLILSIIILSCSKYNSRQSELEKENIELGLEDYPKNQLLNEINQGCCEKKEYTETSFKSGIYNYSYVEIDIAIEYPYINYQNESSSINKTFKIEDIYDRGELDMWYFKCLESKVFLVELDDYYMSVFFVYKYARGHLYNIDNFAIGQPNVEDEGLKEKNIEVKIKEGSMEITTFLDDEKDNKYNFEFKNATELELIQ